MEKQKAKEVTALLEENYGKKGCALKHSNPFELLIATILSAQCTDVRVNIVTKTLFAQADNPRQFLSLGREALTDIIRPCGLSASKAANIIKTCEMLEDGFCGRFPADFDALVSLPGVGRKTANVVLSNAFGIDAIAVDTHVFRVSNRIGLAKSDNVLETEKMLMRAIPKDKWSGAHHWLIWHGREVCTARNPKCSACILNALCEWPQKKRFMDERT
jgi:endonuclease-3